MKIVGNNMKLTKKKEKTIEIYRNLSRSVFLWLKQYKLKY